MEVTVLGSSGTYPTPGKACSGYLVSEGSTHLLLDCGPGVVANLQSHTTIQELGTVVISHMHPDHFLDLVPMCYAIAYGEQHPSGPLPVSFPPGGADLWERLVALFGESTSALRGALMVSEYRPGEAYSLGSLEFRPMPVRHYVPSYGVRVSAGAVLAYSSDAGPCPELVALARGADLFLCEATLLEADVPPHERGHLLAKEAGLAAQEADVRRLVLTHISPGVDSRKSLEAARSAFHGWASVAVEGDRYCVPER